jgi:membrane-associated phospholipid phosphatase
VLKLFKDNRYFFFIAFIYLVGGFLVLIFIPKGTIEITLNKHHNKFLDIFFYYITFLGDGIFSVLFIILLFFRKIYYGIVCGVAFLFSTFIVQGLKRFFFAETLRPSKFFEGIEDLYYIDGLQIHSHFSFPSGHTSGAFTLFCFLALISKNVYAEILFFLLAFLVGLSRIYLLQHFFIDTYFGALIAIAATAATYYYFEMHTDLKHKDRLNRPLLR